MRLATVLQVVSAVFLWESVSVAKPILWQIGGKSGSDWEESTFLNVMMEAGVSSEGSMQPLELLPDLDIVSRLGNWNRYRAPLDLDYVVGEPRAWRGLGMNSWPGYSANPLILVDGDVETHYTATDFGNSPWDQFYTLDFGLPIPAERFVVIPAEGADPFTQEPYRPNFAFEKFELTASTDVAMVNRQKTAVGGERAGGYQPLEILLKHVPQNLQAVINIEFQPQYLQFFRIMFYPDGSNTPGDPAIFSKYSLADFEIYGRGFVPKAKWVSKVIDMEQIVNIGSVRYGESKWRKEAGNLLPAPEAPAHIQVAIRTGLDDTPISYRTYNDLQEKIEISRSGYEKLKPRVFSYDPPSVGWRGPVIEDQNQWSFWSSPIRESGQLPRVPRGRYFQVQIQAQTEELWEFARMDSLMIEVSPLLAERVLGEIALVDDLHPEGKLVQIEAGKSEEFLYDVVAEFTDSGQEGFDVIRFLTPATSSFLELKMGEPLALVTPDSVVTEISGFAVYLPQRIRHGEASRLRVRLETTIFGASGQIRAEVFARTAASLPQIVEPGDVSDEIETSQLRVLAKNSSLGSVLGTVDIRPATITPQGDQINDQTHINFTLFRIFRETAVEIDLFSLGGERVKQLLADELVAGRHSVVWDGRDDAGRTVAPGIYLARLRVTTDRGATARILPIAVAY
jgi:hypothetical protein